MCIRDSAWTGGVPGDAAEWAPRAERGQPGAGSGALGRGSRGGEGHRRGRPPAGPAGAPGSAPGAGGAVGGEAVPGEGGVARPAPAFYVAAGMEDARLIMSLRRSGIRDERVLAAMTLLS